MELQNRTLRAVKPLLPPSVVRQPTQKPNGLAGLGRWFGKAEEIDS